MGDIVATTIDSATGETTKNETPDSSTGAEGVSSESSKEQETSAGGEQSQSQDGSGNESRPQKRGNSPFAQNRELRAKLREQEAAFNSRFQELTTRIEELTGYLQNGGQEEDPSGAFWKNPPTFLRNELGNFKKEMLKELLEVQNQSKEQMARTQEMSEAVKFIRSQNGMTDEGVEEIRELLRDIPGVESLSPMAQAKVALGLWLSSRGITDKSALKAKAGIPSGAPPTNGAKRTWTNAEVEAEISKRFPRDYSQWTPETKTQFEAFKREIEQAKSEGRLK